MMGWGPHPIRLVAVAHLAVNLRSAVLVINLMILLTLPLFFSPGDKSSPARAPYDSGRGLVVTWSGGAERRASGEDLPARVGTAFHSHFAGRTPDGDGQKLMAWIRVGWGEGRMESKMFNHNRA